MARTPEAAVKAEIVAHLKARNIWYDMRTSRGFGRKGIPDLLICHRGRFIAIEIKSEWGDVSSWQEREMKHIKDNGGIAVVAQAPLHMEVLKDVLR